MAAKQWCIGVLGCGYVGQQLLQQLLQQQWHHFSWHRSSWYTVHHNDAQLAYQSIGFSLDNADSWDNLPQQADCLVFTIPPGYQDRQKEAQRLTDWCDWMKLNRPGLKRLIYISTIGVYSDDADIYTEQSQCRPSSLKGHLRLMSEQILSRYFQCSAIRCGGIYGPERNIVEKLLAGKAVYRGNKPMYRIHLEDLVNIITQLVEQSTAIDCINAVDGHSASQDEIIEWLLQQPYFKEQAPQSLNFQRKRLDADATAVARIISNRLIFAGLGYRLQYPNFKALVPSGL